MEYKGKYSIFNTDNIKTYPIFLRRNKVKINSFVKLDVISQTQYEISSSVREKIKEVALQIIRARKAKKPVIFFTGAHLIKNGLSPILLDLIKRNMVTLIASNGAGAIHDFELSLMGETSEDVPNALPEGKFGMAYEFAYINETLRLGNIMKLGYGESLGRVMGDAHFKEMALKSVLRKGSPENFKYPDKSVLAVAYEHNIPVTIHAAIGTDVVDEHPGFDGETRGGTSGRDFLIFVNEVTKLDKGGVILNVGSAVIGPEVLLKAVSMAANTAHPPKSIITADFDLRPFRPENMSSEEAYHYYFRDQKSVVTRIPESFGGKGFYIQGNQKITLPLLYQYIIKCLEEGQRRGNKEK